MSRPFTQKITLQERIHGFQNDRGILGDLYKKYLNFDDFSDEELEELFMENEEFLRTPDEQGFYPIHFFALNPTSLVNGKILYDPRIFKIFADLGLINLQTVKDGYTALHCVAIDSCGYLDKTIVDILLSNGIDPNITDHDGNKAIWRASKDLFAFDKLLKLTSDEDLAQPRPRYRGVHLRYSFLDRCLLNNDLDYPLFKRFSGADLNFNFFDLDNLKKAIRAKFILGLSYSEESFAISAEVMNLLMKQIGQNILFTHKDKFLEVFDNLDKTFELKDGRKLKIEPSPSPGHAVFFVFEYDQRNSLIGFYYCDGNLPILLKGDNPEYGYGACYYKTKKAEKDISQDLLRDLREVAQKAETGEQFNQQAPDVLKKYVVTHRAEKLPKAHKLILTKPQKRGNCSLKARHILFRLMISLIHPQEMVFAEQNGLPCGSGYKAYKDYKRSLVRTEIKDLLELTQEEYRGKACYSSALQTLQDFVFLHAITKGDVELLRAIEEIFIRNDIDFAKIQTSSGNNFIDFAIFNLKSPEIEKWLIEKLDTIPDKSIIHQAKETESSYLIDAILFKRIPLAKKLVEIGVDVNREGKYRKTTAISYCFPYEQSVYKQMESEIEELVRALADRGANLNPTFQYPEDPHPQKLLDVLEKDNHPGYKFLKELIEEKSRPSAVASDTSRATATKTKSSLCTIL